MTQMMRKKGEDHLYLYDPKDFDGSVFEIVSLEDVATPAPVKAKRNKAPAPVASAPDLTDDDFDFAV